MFGIQDAFRVQRESQRLAHHLRRSWSEISSARDAETHFYLKSWRSPSNLHRECKCVPSCWREGSGDQCMEMSVEKGAGTNTVQFGHVIIGKGILAY